MSPPTILRLWKTLVPTDSQATDPTINQRQTAHPSTIWAGSQQHTRAIEVVLLLVSQDVAGPNDPMVELLLATLWLHGRPCRDWIDQQTTVHIAVRTYVQDPRVGHLLGQQMFRRLVGERFDQSWMTSTTFEEACGGAGVIVAQWRPESQPTAVAAPQRQPDRVMEHPASAQTTCRTIKTASMSHWSWWAERMLLKESFA